MKQRATVTRCRACGKEIGVIPFGIYRKSLVDLPHVMVAADPEGEDYVRIDGSKVKAVEVPYDSEGPAEPAYRQHRKTCGGKP